MSSPLVSAEWLEAHLSDSDIRILDGSWYLPQMNRDAKAEFAAGHIPGAQYFDIDAVADTASPYPHTLPSAEQFAAQVSALGISNDHHVIVYDGMGLFSAGRVWWMFKVFGHDNVSLLDGGLRAWRAGGYPLSDDLEKPKPGSFRAVLQTDRVATLPQMKAVVAGGTSQILDARSKGRFTGADPEPRAGLRGGHMPGSVCLPFSALTNPETGKLLPADQIEAAFRQTGIDVQKPVFTSCGSGVTAAALAFGLAVLGRDDVIVYDGSWSEWGAQEDTPVITGEE